MKHVVKIMILVFIIVLVVKFQGEDILYEPQMLDELPMDVSELSVEEQSKILNKIAVFSYQTLLEVPTQGLKSQQKNIKKIIVLRKWLQKHQYPLFQLLAFRLIAGVDNAILNEVFRKEIKIYEIISTSPKFKVGSFDKALLQKLLSLNKINEKNMVKHAISLNGKLTNYCRQQNYLIKNYLNGHVMKHLLSEKIHNNMFNIKYSFQPYLKKFSRPIANDLVFIQMFGIIDRHRDIQLLMKIYFENGFPRDSDELKILIKSKLLINQKNRISTGYRTTVEQIMDTLLSSVEHNPSLSHGLGVTIFFLPFINDLDIIPTQFFDKLPNEFKHCKGQWLTFSEDMESDENKMTQEDINRIKYCPIINKITSP